MDGNAEFGVQHGSFGEFEASEKGAETGQDALRAEFGRFESEFHRISGELEKISSKTVSPMRKQVESRLLEVPLIQKAPLETRNYPCAETSFRGSFVA